MNRSALDALEEHLHMLALTGKPLKGLQSFAPMLHAKSKCCINNSSDDFHLRQRKRSGFDKT